MMVHLDIGELQPALVKALGLHVRGAPMEASITDARQ
jgi:hypothetical protein